LGGEEGGGVRGYAAETLDLPFDMRASDYGVLEIVVVASPGFVGNMCFECCGKVGEKGVEVLDEKGE
jgi:hypothetical protein